MQKFEFHANFTISVTGDLTCAHMTSEAIVTLVSKVSHAAGHLVLPEMMNVVEECHDDGDHHDIKMKIHIPREGEATNPHEKALHVMDLLNVEAFRNEFGDEEVTDVHTSNLSIRGEITVRMPPLDGTERHAW